jgi:FAD/FMN-containing dehydrogenase
MPQGTVPQQPAEDGVLAALASIVGPGRVLTDPAAMAPYLRDWVGDHCGTALAVVLPGGVDEVAGVVRACAAAAVAVVPQGGNTGLVAGTWLDGRRAGILLNLARMNRIGAVDPDSATAVVEAGAIVEAIQTAAADKGMLFPLSFGAKGSAQIGGALSTNAGGLNVLRYGMARDMVLGLQVVLPDGQVLDLMSDLRKDNRGPDLKHLFIGAEGTLGIITAAVLRLWPAVTRSETAFLALRDLEALTPLQALARRACGELMTAFELIPQGCVDDAVGFQSAIRPPLSGRHDQNALVSLAASAPVDLRGLLEAFLSEAMAKGLVVDGVVAESHAQSTALWAIREAMVEAQIARGRHVRTDVSVRPGAIAPFITAAEAEVRRAAPGWRPLSYGHVGDGNVHLNVMPPEGLDEAAVIAAAPRILAAIYGEVDAVGGSISAEHGIGRSRLSAHLARVDPVRQALFAALKDRIDPAGLMNPGCLIPAADPASKAAEPTP